MAKTVELSEEEVHLILDWATITHTKVSLWTHEDAALKRKIARLLMEEVKVEHGVEQRTEDVPEGDVYGHCTR